MKAIFLKILAKLQVKTNNLTIYFRFKSMMMNRRITIQHLQSQISSNNINLVVLFESLLFFLVS